LEFEFEKIYIDKNVYSNKVWTERANKVKKRFNKAAVKTVDSHWKIPELYNFDPSKWIEAKRKVLVLGIKKGMQMQCSGRSTDSYLPLTLMAVFLLVCIAILQGERAAQTLLLYF